MLVYGIPCHADCTLDTDAEAITAIAMEAVGKQTKGGIGAKKGMRKARQKAKSGLTRQGGEV